MIRIIMHGCNGRMGQMITGLAEKDPDVEIVAGVDVSDHIQNSYPIFDSIAKCDVAADVVIDFASAKAVDGLLDYCVDKKL
ncbi:MAG: 4-hydroxy-tetrahydrodipicolinate reductase, partial [Lachnospiraceae bacterium]